jgi:hypothetical protein
MGSVSELLTVLFVPAIEGILKLMPLRVRMNVQDHQEDATKVLGIWTLWAFSTPTEALALNMH